MAIADRSSTRRMGVLLIAFMLCTAGSVQTAAAQGLFDALFGGFQRRAPRQLPPETSSYADPVFGESRRPSADSGFGHGTVYCVRTCDGRYFPLQRHAGASPADLCRSFCPTAKTMVFSGSRIDTAVAQNGTRYADLDKAFGYHDKVTDTCSCNGKDGLDSRASRPPAIRRCGRAISLRPTTASPLSRARAATRNSRRSTRHRANGRAAWPR